MAWWGGLALCAGGCALEVVAVAAALGGEAGMALAAHAGGCAGLSSGLRRRLAPGRGGWSLLFGLQAFLPVLGALGLLATELWGRSPRALPALDLVRTRIPGFQDVPARTPAQAPGRAPATASRGAQVAEARKRNDPRAIALLRRAIEDPDEDVRLVAYAVLEAKSREADRRLHETSRALEAAPPERRADLHHRLAAEHWDLAWLGLAQGEHLAHVLEEARRHCLAALADEPRRASLHFLLGRVELRMGEPARAEAALEGAVGLGFPEEISRPYRAEAAFLRRRFDLVRAHLSALPAAGGDPAVERLRRYWS
jgi:hypothetical protein